MFITNLTQFIPRCIYKNSNKESFRIINGVTINISRKIVEIKCDACTNIFTGQLQNYIDKEKHLCIVCRNTGENAPFYGKHHSEETINYLKKECVITEEKLGKKKYKQWRKSLNERWNKTEHPMKGNHHSDETKEQISTVKKNNPESNTKCIEYWIAKGYTKEQAEKLLSESQRTFTLEKCIQKHGKKKGTEIWQERQRKWLKSFPKNNYSKISQELFWSIHKKIKSKYKEIYFAENGKNHNNEYRIKSKTSYKLLDFYIKDINKCIEFDGDYWHGSRGNIERDKKRERDILKENPEMQIFHVKEYDYKKDKNKIIEKCLNFLGVK